MRFVSSVIVVSLCITLLLWLPQDSGQTDGGKFTKGEVVLRLRYRGFLEKPITVPYRIGLFVLYGEGGPGFPNFVGIDWEGNIYISDPTEPDWCILQCYDRRGKFRWSWGPIPTVLKVSATKDNYLWVFMRPIPDGFPVIVLQKGKKKPKLIWDWSRSMPEGVENRMRKVVEDRGFKWERREDDWWSVGGPETGPRQVALWLSAEFLKPEEISGIRVCRCLWVLMSSDGSQVLDAKVVEPWEWLWETTYLAPDGSFWLVKQDLDIRRGTWSKLWVWEKGEREGKPLIDRSKKKEPWADKFILGRARCPSVEFDAKHIYLIWERGVKDPLKYPLQRFIVEGKVLDLGCPAVTGENALIVLDRRRRLVTYLPWTPVSMEKTNTWIKPLPDGSGFYRIEYREREAVIYFHPLPK